MKTVLLSRTAVALVGAMSLPVNAAEWNERVGGVSVGDDFFRGTLGTTFLENDLNNDVQRFTYFTPRFSSHPRTSAKSSLLRSPASA